MTRIEWAGGRAAELTTLVNRVYAVAEAGFWRPGTDRTSLAEMESYVAAGQIAVALSGGAVAGCVRIHDGEFGLLASRRRGSGVGGALVDFAERVIRDRGHDTIRLELLVPRDRPHPGKEFLRSWYTRRGYRRTATTPLETAYPAFAPLATAPFDITTYEKPLAVP